MARGVVGTARPLSLQVALSVQEHAALSAAREHTGYPQLGSWAREVLLAHVEGLAEREHRGGGGEQVGALVDEVRALRGEVHAVGVNTNQAVARLNTLGVLPETAARLDELSRHIAGFAVRIYDVLKRLDGLGRRP